jgi:hypothetical protein
LISPLIEKFEAFVKQQKTQKQIKLDTGGRWDYFRSADNFNEKEPHIEELPGTWVCYSHRQYASEGSEEGNRTGASGCAGDTGLAPVAGISRRTDDGSVY